MLQDDKKLVDIRASKGLESGLTPSVLPAAGAVWRDGRHVWFRETHLQQVYGNTRIVSDVHRKPRALAQAYVDGQASLYYEDLGVINRWREDGSTLIIGNGDSDGQFEMVPWGTWLAMTDNVGQPQLWKGTGAFIDIGVGEFGRAKILRKLGQHLMAFGTDVFPSGFHWSDASDPEMWTPLAVNLAGNLPIRDLDSDIIAVVDMGIGLGMYSRAHVILVQYVGYPDVIGTPSQALSGIGAVSKQSVISLGRDNWGLNHAGVFTTNGATYEYVDGPAVSTFIKEEVDFGRAAEIAGHYDEHLGLIIWATPTKSGEIKSLAINPKSRSFTFLETDLGVGLEQEVFNHAIAVKSDGIYFRSVATQLQKDFFLATQLLNGNSQTHVKSWDYMICEGEFTEAEIRFGFTDTPSMESIQWLSWVPLAYKVPFGPRESIFMAFEIKSNAMTKISGITLFGEMGGEA